jgi:hypothetical protein
MITVGSGKLYVIDPVFSIDCSWLGVLFLTHFLLYVKRSLKVQPAWAIPGRGRLREWALNELVGAGAPCC